MKIKKGDQLGERNGLPKDLQELLEKFPRESWGEDVLNGNWVGYWLGRHSLFRKITFSINSIIEKTLDNKMSSEDFIHQYSQHMSLMLKNLDSHHLVEDNYIFPRFYDKSQKFIYGLDLLENDHHLIHNSIDNMIFVGNKLIKSVSSNSNYDIKDSLGKYKIISDNFNELLTSHLNDEEDLLIPLVIQHGEKYFGLGH